MKTKKTLKQALLALGAAIELAEKHYDAELAWGLEYTKRDVQELLEHKKAGWKTRLYEN